MKRENITSNIRVVGSNWNQVKFPQPVNRVLLKALPTNAATIWVDVDNRAEASNCYPLQPGDTLPIAINDLYLLDLLFVNAADQLCMVSEIGVLSVEIL